MAVSQVSTVARFIREIRSSEENRNLSDGNLLRRFVIDRDESAFAALVERHSCMVMTVCRRIVGDHHLAEDAYQASFSVLARKAASVQRYSSLAGWLHGVACRTAMKARALSISRRQGAPLFDTPAPDRAQELIWNDLRPIIDQEINRLPEKYRVPFILCYLDGKTNAETALELRCPEGTIVTRLARARARLRHRLTRRGITLSLAVFSTAIHELATPTAVSAEMVRVVTRVALQFVMGRTAVGEAFYLQSIVLAKGVLKAMLVSKLKTGSAFFLIASMVVATSYYTLAETQAEVKPDKPRVAHSNPDKGKEEKPATPTPYVLEFNPDKGKIEPRLLPPNAVNPAQKPHYQPILITTFYQPIVEGGALGDPMPFQLEISGQPPELLGALLKRMLDAIQPGNLKREKLSAEEKLDKILERLDRLEHQLESTKTKQP